MTAPGASERARSRAAVLNRVVYRFSRHWLAFFSLALLLFVGLPWLAPVFMRIGWIGPAEALYQLYRLFCHQMPQRSSFLFGSDFMIPTETVRALWPVDSDPLLLRQFVGDVTLGWKVAWSDRMVSMYTSLFLFGLAFWPMRRRLRPLPVWALPALLLPMLLDGLSHMVSDVVGGVLGGFRYDNGWLAALTGHAFPTTFYAGDAWGSFNAWLRLVTGVLFGLGVVWFAYPHLHMGFQDTAAQIEARFERAGRALTG